MSLELKLIDIGTVDYDELKRIQHSLYDSTQDDLLISASVNPKIEMGSNMHRNKFSEEIEQEFQNTFGDIRDASGKFTSEFQNYLTSQGVRGYQISFARRGGGVTVVNPGQQLYFLRIHMNDILDSDDYYQNTGKTVKHIRNVMMRVAKQYLPEEQIVLADLGKSESTQDQSFDIAYYDGAKLYKLGSKGIRLSCTENIHQVFGGFCFHVDKDSIVGMDFIQPCGIPLSNVGVTSFEHLNARVKRDELNKVVLRHLAQELSYTSYSTASKSDYDLD